jgi:hypothetical protein
MNRRMNLNLNNLIRSGLGRRLMHLVMLALLAAPLIGRHAPARAMGEDANALYQMVINGQTDEALQAVIDEAWSRGGWQAAPGDLVVYDPYLPPWVGGAIWVIDQPPFECSDAKLRLMIAECQINFAAKENRVRIGRSMFVKDLPDGSSAPRLATDDIVATYLEEVGHSWQEYLYETEGVGSGARTRQTSWEYGTQNMHGWEYQIKRYILSLNGAQLALSGEVQARLRMDICGADGYANPVGRNIPAYGPPPGWPNAQGWPMAAPTPEEYAVFCAG